MIGGQVATLAYELRVADRVRFTGPVRDLPAVLPALDVLVCASREEGFGLAAVEAMAAGVPSDADGTRARRSLACDTVIDHPLNVSGWDRRVLSGVVTEFA